ncbi:MAG: glycosyltransferase family 4 protein [Dysgonamonadaceae bacterium]|jgi:glycosyltransferase involved in cell wall biosynthesis|nr:glycosyltransferase family 4 protein [Dysgonamonadaceae bacterium]
MNILHVTFNLTTGGAETMLIDIINRQCLHASVSLLIVNDVVDTHLRNTIDKKVNIHLINRKEHSRLQLFTAFIKVNRLLNTLKPDVIHCHDIKLLPLFAFHRTKTVLTVHAIGLNWCFTKYFKKIFAISESVKADVDSHSGKQATVIYNGIKCNEYHKRTDYRFIPTTEQFKIVFLSRLCPAIKGQHVAIEALRLLKDNPLSPNISLTFIGDGDALSDLLIQAKQCGVADDISFLGKVDRQWVKTHLHEYHLLIQPSLSEGFGLTVIEGFAAGLPVIASNIDGPREILSTLQAGLTVEPSNPQALADKIMTVYNSYCAGNIQNTSYFLQDATKLQQFDVATTADNYLKTYSLLIQQ